MKKALILIVILLMLFFILCSFSSGEPSGTTGEFVKGDPLHCQESCLSKNC
jgi:hypothetical protein